MSEYVVDVLPVFDTITDQAPPLVDRSIIYPIIGEPPSFPGVIQLRLMVEEETDDAVRPVGGCGTVVTVPDAVVAVAMFEGELVPTELIAETRYV